MGMFHYYNLKVSEVFIFDDFLINQIKEGVTIKSHHNTELKTLIDTHFQDKNIAYISNRVMSYSVDPMTYKETAQIPNLVAMAVIPKTESMRKSANYEKQFYKKPYEIFDNLSAAIIWVHSIIAFENSVVKNM
ncbi:hypothetical protein N7U66_20295 [Lacinutrix neustonica]|uniref:Uncharacterized protein n=1 Tax=Lacinutrix neustonica TaxID=2980107 RepID=A0A9E8MV12_9FLAO|nr:hypothetical protein [Lacinutrix neustonica]WAC02092.1 hypothetical protein N7U66_20295 [Lacinutrix neustonica]